MLRRQVGIGVAGNEGFTLVELLVALAVVAVLSALTAPSFAQWRQNIEYRKAARDIVCLLREARSRAIATNREHRVEYEPASRKYGLRAGDRAVNTNWPDAPPVTSWETLPPEVNMSSNVPSVQFNTNGTANGGTIRVMDENLVQRYEIVVNRTGRIRIK